MNKAQEKNASVTKIKKMLGGGIATVQIFFVCRGEKAWFFTILILIVCGVKGWKHIFYNLKISPFSVLREKYAHS